MVPCSSGLGVCYGDYNGLVLMCGFFPAVGVEMGVGNITKM